MWIIPQFFLRKRLVTVNVFKIALHVGKWNCFSHFSNVLQEKKKKKRKKQVSLSAKGSHGRPALWLGLTRTPTCAPTQPARTSRSLWAPRSLQLQLPAELRNAFFGKPLVEGCDRSGNRPVKSRCKEVEMLSANSSRDHRPELSRIFFSWIPPSANLSHPTTFKSRFLKNVF